MVKDNNGQYEIGGIGIASLVEKYGSPLYIYDTAIIRRQYERLIKAFENTRLDIHYACKALNNINIMRYICGLGAGLDAVSIQEVQLGFKAGFDPKRIIYTSNSVSVLEYEQAIETGVHVNIDNLYVLKQIGDKYGDSVPVSIRINPHIMGGGHLKISTGHADSKFGISRHRIPDILEIVKTCGMKVSGLHMHTGSDILDIDVFLKGAEVMFDVARHFPNLQFLDFGSGFKVPYKPDDYATDIELLGSLLTQRFNDFCKEYGKELTLKFEPGKFLVSQAGYLAAKVNVMKQTASTVFASVDTGLNHLIRPMFYDAYHHIINASNPNGTPHVYTVAGYICETDTFAKDREISEITVGDILVFQNAGAYGMTMASNYNARPRPAEVMLRDGKDYLIRKRETLDDLLRNQVDIA
ncbi:MAG: diaminopimelate decarboxylase [Bacteroidales bacterium]|jgi:diaminopimelate decarboxylase|nr:diaminopimelate decarboxylase [Bacteroidales bacterium]